MLTAAVAALSISSFGAFVAFGSAQAVWANETPGPVQSELLPRSVVEQAQTEDQAITDFQIPETVETKAPDVGSLADLVADLSSADLPDREAECLAGAVYFEAKGESLDGQLVWPRPSSTAHGPAGFRRLCVASWCSRASFPSSAATLSRRLNG
jgi:N-acetylmuramoyl-L-alanine amidase